MDARAPAGGYRPAEVGLEPVDQPQIEAMCEAGYLPVSRYVELAQALGWYRVRLSAAPPRRPEPMAQQAPRPITITTVV